MFSVKEQTVLVRGISIEFGKHTKDTCFMHVFTNDKEYSFVFQSEGEVLNVFIDKEK